MSKALKITGGTLTAIGAVSLFICLFMVIMTFAVDREMEELATGSDFHGSGETFSTRIDSLDVTLKLSVEVRSRLTTELNVDITVIDDTGESVKQSSVVTPRTVDVDMSGDLSDYWDVIVEVEDGTGDLSDIEVTVRGDTISDNAALICCGGILFGIFGVLMLIVGIILLVVGFVRVKKSSERGQGTYKTTGSFEVGTGPPGEGYGFNRPQDYGANHETRPPDYDTNPGDLYGERYKPKDYDRPSVGRPRLAPDPPDDP